MILPVRNERILAEHIGPVVPGFATSGPIGFSVLLVLLLNEGQDFGLELVAGVSEKDGGRNVSHSLALLGDGDLVQREPAEPFGALAVNENSRAIAQHARALNSLCFGEARPVLTKTVLRAGRRGM